jgi:hypothetical protein
MFESEFCSVKYLEDINVVLVTWKKYCSGEDYRKPLLFAIKIMSGHPGCDFVADTTDGFEDAPEDTQWLLNTFIPLARQTDCQRIFFIIDRDNTLKNELDAQTGELKNYFTVQTCFDLSEVRQSLKDTAK